MYDILVATVGIVVLLGSWVAVQSLVRRSSPDIGDGEDVLACRMCSDNGSCNCGMKKLRAAKQKKVVGS